MNKPESHETMKEETKALWKRCFNDSEAFTDLYFRMRYTDEVNLVVREEGKVVSALQMLPYPMTFCGHTVPTSYVSGACTHPDFQGRGVMRGLLTQAFAAMYRNGALFSTLIPAESWLFGYYAGTGYAPVFLTSANAFTLPETPVASQEAPLAERQTVESITRYDGQVYTYLNKRLSERDCCILHTPDDFRVILADLALGGGHLFVSRAGHEIYGLAIMYKSGERELTIGELLAENEETRRHLLRYACGHTGCNRFVELCPPDEANSTANAPYPLGMARIIRAEEALRLYASAFPEDEMSIALTDGQLPANNGYYRLHNGECSYTTTPSPDLTYTPTDIKELTDHILRPLHPYMSLMLN